MKWTLLITLLIVPLAGCKSPQPGQTPPTGTTVVNAPLAAPLAKPQKTYTLTLAWNNDGNPHNYQLGWAQDTNYGSLSRPATNTSFRVVNLYYGTLYYFAVRSVTSNNNYSVWSVPLRYSQKQSNNGPGAVSAPQP